MLSSSIVLFKAGGIGVVKGAVNVNSITETHAFREKGNSLIPLRPKGYLKFI